MDDDFKALNTVKDVSVEIRIRNNRILTAMKRKGVTVKQLAEGAGESLTTIYSLINMKIAAHNKKDKWLPAAQKIADFLQYLPEDLFSDAQQRQRLARNRARAEIDFAQLQSAFQHTTRPRHELETEASEAHRLLMSALLSLTPREERILRMRFGVNLQEEMTLEQIAERFSVGRERIRQIEVKALRKLRHPSRSSKIRTAVSNKFVTTGWNWHGDKELITRYTIDNQVLTEM